MPAPATRPSAAAPRPDRHALAALGALLLLLALAACTITPIYSAWKDECVYLATAESLAQGMGYRHVELPGEPWQTKYPPLYPALLALVYKLQPSLPRAYPVIVALNAALASTALVLWYFVLRRRFGAGPWLAALACALAAINALWFQLQTTAMSEPLAAALMMAALLLIPDETGRDGPARSLSCGVFLALAGMTRVLAAPIGAGVVLWLLVRRRWSRAAMTAAPLLAAMAWWSWHSARAAKLNLAIPQCAGGAFAYDLDYADSWQGSTLADRLWVAWNNLAESVYALACALVYPRVDWFTSALSAGWGAHALVYGALALALILTIAGFISTARAGAPIHLGTVLYLAAVIAWPWSPVRFVALLTPILIFWALRGALGLPRCILPRAAPHATGTAGIILASACVAAALACSASQLNIKLNDSLRAPTAQGFDAMAEMITLGTPPDAVVASQWGGVMHLLTGRKVVPPTPGASVIQQRYPRSRRWWKLGLETSPGQLDEQTARITTRMDAYHDTAGVTHMIVPKAGGEVGAVMLQHFRADPARFSLLGENSTDWLVKITRPATP